MKKNKMEIKPVFKESIKINDPVTDVTSELFVSKHDQVEVAITMKADGWAFMDSSTIEILRMIMREKVDRQIGRFTYIK